MRILELIRVPSLGVANGTKRMHIVGRIGQPAMAPPAPALKLAIPSKARCLGNGTTIAMARTSEMNRYRQSSQMGPGQR
jgi:hypothetical protein